MGPETQPDERMLAGVAPAPTRRPARRRSVPAPTDGDLLAGCRNGDDAAWASLVARYERLVFSVAVRNGLSREDAADVTQTTFVAVLDAIDRLQADQPLTSWLMTVARRQAWRVRRRRDREHSALGVAPDDADPIVDWERVAWLHEGLEQLGDPCRALLAALYLDPTAPSYAEIAARFDRPVGGIGPARGRCLEHLRTILGEDVHT